MKVQQVVGEEWVDDDDDDDDSICCCGVVVVDVKRENLLKNSSIVLSCGSFVFVFPPVNFCFFFDTVTDVRTLVLIFDSSSSPSIPHHSFPSFLPILLSHIPN